MENVNVPFKGDVVKKLRIGFNSSGIYENRAKRRKTDKTTHSKSRNRLITGFDENTKEKFRKQTILTYILNGKTISGEEVRKRIINKKEPVYDSVEYREIWHLIDKKQGY